jgi:hypothetical protein
MGTVNSCAQVVQTPTAGVVLSHLSTLRVRFDMTDPLMDGFSCEVRDSMTLGETLI